MLATEINKADLKIKKEKTQLFCYHCGIPCITDNIAIGEKFFCCEGCKLVYEILNENGLCDYYKLESHPGLSQIKSIRTDKYAYLDNEQVAEKLYKFTDGSNVIVSLYIPNIHCSSCMWLMDHLYKLNKGISESKLNFTTKEVTIHFSLKHTSIRKVVELLATIGYEPYISLHDVNKNGIKNINKQRIYKLGIAGFCFGNIMMLSFPEYLSLNSGIEHQYSNLFRMLNLFLALPVFFYCASEFFLTAWAGIKQRILNIDTPIALAILITFGRSIFEIITNTGAGYLDSMSGIVFFMLVGRAVQERTYRSISFNRDYKSYFPIAVNVITTSGIISKNLQDLKEKDIVQLHNDEIIPADSIVLEGNACIDYSFVSGESDTVDISIGKMVYAGGRQVGEQLKIQVLKPVAGSYLTSLWNHYAFKNDKQENNNAHSVVHTMSKYFTWILLTLATITAIYWGLYDPTKIMVSVSAMLIVACPCALLLCVTYTNGNLLRILSNNGLFLRDASVIEQLKNVDHIVFDKTGTLTNSTTHIIASGHQLTESEKDILYNVVASSKHPYSKAIADYTGTRRKIHISSWEEWPGKGIKAIINNSEVLVGSSEFALLKPNLYTNATVYVNINGKHTTFQITSNLREGIQFMLSKLGGKYALSLLSGDNDKQRSSLEPFFDNHALLFEQKPIDKLNYISALQQQGSHVLMVGDGLNDAGALQQSNVGVTLADDINTFTPSCDAILDAKRFSYLPQILKLAKRSSFIINLGFAVSILYNIIGLYFAMAGQLKPVNAAILMPCSTLSIVLITTGVSSLIAKRLGLVISSDS